VRFD